MYKVTKKEMLRRRPDWMTTLLLNIHPSLYDKRPSANLCTEALGTIREIIAKSKALLDGKHLHVQDNDNETVITNRNGRPYLKFTVEKV